MLLIPWEECITNRANWNNGGAMPRARVSEWNRIALLSSILASSMPFWGRTYVLWLPATAYAIDDGKGGKIHVNVSTLIWRITRLLTWLWFRGTCRPFIDHHPYVINPWTLGHLVKTLAILGLSKPGERGEVNMALLSRQETSIFCLAWLSPGEIIVVNKNIMTWLFAGGNISEQLFFIAFARIWARKITTAAAVSSNFQSRNSFALILDPGPTHPFWPTFA
jgi:hypothetical protein